MGKWHLIKDLPAGLLAKLVSTDVIVEAPGKYVAEGTLAGIKYGKNLVDDTDEIVLVMRGANGDYDIGVTDDMRIGPIVLSAPPAVVIKPPRTPVEDEVAKDPGGVMRSLVTLALVGYSTWMHDEKHAVRWTWANENGVWLVAHDRAGDIWSVDRTAGNERPLRVTGLNSVAAREQLLPLLRAIGAIDTPRVLHIRKVMGDAELQRIANSPVDLT